jgi:hypothetical protein
MSRSRLTNLWLQILQEPMRRPGPVWHSILVSCAEHGMQVRLSLTWQVRGTRGSGQLRDLPEAHSRTNRLPLRPWTSDCHRRGCCGAASAAMPLPLGRPIDVLAVGGWPHRTSHSCLLAFSVSRGSVFGRSPHETRPRRKSRGNAEYHPEAPVPPVGRKLTVGYPLPSLRRPRPITRHHEPLQMQIRRRHDG